tara:strand:+ start:2140 stop:3021 length:882 start_codon:yes stop_codon:yes gene_type:complete
MKKNNLVGGFIIGTFVLLYILTSLISTIHVIDFFEMSNPRWMAISLAVAFEVGAAASLASLITLDKMNKTLVWALFITITGMQIQGNMYYAFKSLDGFQVWSELFNLIEEDPLYQKRILALVSGAILPLVALGFIKSLVDYIKPSEENVDDADKLKADVSTLTKELEDLEESEEWDEEYDAYIDRHAPEDDEEIEDSEEFDEDHALDMVMNYMVEEDDIEEEPYVSPFIEPTVPKPEVDTDKAYEFGKNLYQTTMQKMNSDHLPKPSAEETNKAYNNLGLTNPNSESTKTIRK